MTEPKNGSTRTQSERLTILETSFHSLQYEVHNLATTMRDSFTRLSEESADAYRANQKQISDLADAISKKGQISQGSIIGIFGAVATWSAILCGGIWFLVTMGNEPMKVRFDEIKASFEDHKNDHGHPTLLKDISSIQSQMLANKQATEIQNNRLASLEEWLNTEGQTLRSTTVVNQERINDIHDEIRLLLDRTLHEVKERNGRSP